MKNNNSNDVGKSIDVSGTGAGNYVGKSIDVSGTGAGNDVGKSDSVNVANVSNDVGKLLNEIDDGAKKLIEGEKNIYMAFSLVGRIPLGIIGIQTGSDLTALKGILFLDCAILSLLCRFFFDDAKANEFFHDKNSPLFNKVADIASPWRDLAWKPNVDWLRDVSKILGLQNVINGDPKTIVKELEKKAPKKVQTPKPEVTLEKKLDDNSQVNDINAMKVEKLETQHSDGCLK